MNDHTISIAFLKVEIKNLNKRIQVYDRKERLTETDREAIDMIKYKLRALSGTVDLLEMIVRRK